MKNDFKLIVSLLQNTRFKVSILILLILSFMAYSCILPKFDVIEGIYHVMSWDYFIMVLLFLFVFNTYNIYTELIRNYSFMIRVGDYKEFYKKMVKFTLVSNLILFLIVMFIVVFLSIIKTGVNYKIYSFNDYKVSNLAYIIFFSIRSYLILNILVIIMVSIYRLLNEILLILTSGFILVSIPALSNTITSSKITSVFNLPLYYGKYFIYNNYGTFIFEVCMSILYICLFSSVASLLINLVSNKKNDLETNLL